ncbi:MAG: hypothetical protein IE937_12015 [Gammaproteobacteria bacterium]|nr:hypothetical protein [Gammaproteobacteria bacterium]
MKDYELVFLTLRHRQTISYLLRIFIDLNQSNLTESVLTGFRPIKTYVTRPVEIFQGLFWRN